MCNLSQGVLERGYARGMEKGMGIGMEKGMGIGMEKGMGIGAQKQATETAKKMLAKKRPVDEIIEFTGLARVQIESIQKET